MNMCFIDRKKHRCASMSHFEQLPEFQKDFKRLSKKYPSLSRDISDLEDVLCVLPTGKGKNFIIVHTSEKIKIVKVRLACRSLRDRSMRVIYAYHINTLTFVYIELYFKGDKENENYERVRGYIKSQIDT